ncbi:hypothetical protein [Acaryochloris sp. IP29b_bin.137]|uniref:hypothetical protein n=1 Tax=Acaryochloris sp. IP29b_bin.137 TaxID=2969217 RepID=UPI002633BADB|nr:hypothetical protein [Acaryochloris sp. IP29b_bin.137]
MSSHENTLLTGPGIGLTFLYYFSMTIIVVVLVGSRSAAFTFASPELHQYGVLAGLIGGVIGTGVNRTIAMDITFENQAKFLTSLNQRFAEIGFELENTEADRSDAIEDHPENAEYLSYFRAGLAGWFAGGIYVVLSEQKATISSRAANIRRIRQLL